MKLKLRLAKLLLFVTPIVAGGVIATSPSQAATLASSEGSFKFNNFSEIPQGTSTSTNTNSVAISPNGQVIAIADAQAIFTAYPPQAENSSLSIATGEKGDYLGIAQSQAQVIGNFLVDAGKSFSFDFAGFLGLETSIDRPVFESASAIGNTFFLLIDSTDSSHQTVLDSLGIFGKLTTLGNDDFLVYQNSESVTLDNKSIDTSFGENQKQEYAFASITGKFSRYFANETKLTLIEVKENEARVRAPEPSNTLALLFCCGLIGVGLKAKRKAAGSSQTPYLYHFGRR